MPKLANCEVSWGGLGGGGIVLAVLIFVVKPVIQKIILQRKL